MNTDKLQVALDDLLKQKAALTAELDSAILSLQAIIAKQRGVKIPVWSEAAHAEADKKSYIDYAEEYLRSISRPAHITEIVKYVGQAANRPDVRRAPIETGLLRHISSKGQSARLIRLGKGMYGLPQHSQRPLLTGDSPVMQ